MCKEDLYEPGLTVEGLGLRVPVLQVHFGGGGHLNSRGIVYFYWYVKTCMHERTHTNCPKHICKNIYRYPRSACLLQYAATIAVNALCQWARVLQAKNFLHKMDHIRARVPVPTITGLRTTVLQIVKCSSHCKNVDLQIETLRRSISKNIMRRNSKMSMRNKLCRTYTAG